MSVLVNGYANWSSILKREDKRRLEDQLIPFSKLKLVCEASSGAYPNSSSVRECYRKKMLLTYLDYKIFKPVILEMVNKMCAVPSKLEDRNRCLGIATM